MTAALPLDNQLCFSLYATSMAVSRAYKPGLDRLGITYPQYLVLHALWVVPLFLLKRAVQKKKNTA